jgi:hypothetical protein
MTTYRRHNLLTQLLIWLESTGAEVVFVSALNEKAATFYRATNFTSARAPGSSGLRSRRMTPPSAQEIQVVSFTSSR